jgi:hypothetical protein
LCQNRGFGKPEPTALAVSAADRHYAKLASFLKGDNDASSLFLTADYSDVPAMVEHTQRETVRRAEREAFLAKQRAERESAEALGQSIFASVGAAVEALSDEGMILAVRAFIQELSVSLEDVAADEIESATESATENMVSLDDGDYAYIGDGDYIYHSDALQYCIDNNELDDYYTDEQVEERIDEAKTEWKREVMEALENVG